jgi:hypothetical protein
MGFLGKRGASMSAVTRIVELSAIHQHRWVRLRPHVKYQDRFGVQTRIVVFRPTISTATIAGAAAPFANASTDYRSAIRAARTRTYELPRCSPVFEFEDKGLDS